MSRSVDKITRPVADETNHHARDPSSSIPRPASRTYRTHALQAPRRYQGVESKHHPVSGLQVSRCGSRSVHRRALSVRYGYSEHEVEDAVLYRKPTASRALYNLIERRLKEGLGWPDRKYNNSMTANASSISTGMSAADGPSDVGAPDKLVRHEPLLPGRRTPSHLASQQSSPSMIHARQFSRERSTYASDQQVLLQSNAIGRSITAGLTRETLNESEPQSRLTSRRLFHDIVARKPSAVGHSIDSTDESQGTRRLPHSSGLVPLKPLTPHHGPMLGIPQLKPVTPRTLRHSTLEHVHPPSVHLASELPVGISNDVRTPKIFRRTTHAESMRQTQQHSPVRYNPCKYHARFSTRARVRHASRSLCS